MDGRRVYLDGAGGLLLPELAMLGRHRETAAWAGGLDPHRHPGVLEVCLIERGAVQWWAGDAVQEVTAGSVYLTGPGEPHGGVDGVLHPCTLQWLQLRLGPQNGSGLPGLDAEEAEALRAALGGLRARCFPAPAAVAPAFRALFLEHERPRGPVALARLAARNALHRLLLAVVAGERAAGADGGVSPAVRRALDWMRDHLAEETRVADAAAVAGLSVPRFHARFAEEVGLPPNQWKLRERVARGRERLLGSDEPVTEVALGLGFGSSQHFATAFKKITGMTPSACRARGRGAAG